MNNKYPFFSIIVPVYNIEEYIKRTLESIIANQFCDYEIIFINDGSTDGSEQILKQFIGKNIFVYYQKNQGLSAARNLGLQKAKGKYIIFLDGDDCITNNMLSSLYNVISKNKCDLYIFGRINNYNNKKNIPYKLSSKIFNSPNDYLYTSLSNSTFRTNVWDKVYCREIIKENNLQFVEGLLYEDMLFLLQYLSHCSIIETIPTEFYLYTMANNTSITKSFRKKDLDVLIFLKMANDFFNINRKLEEKFINIVLQRYALSSLVGKYILFYKKHQIAKDIIDSLFNNDVFKKILSYNSKQRVFKRDYIVSNLIRFCPRLYLFMMKIFIIKSERNL